MIALVARELGLKKQHWKNGEKNFLEFLQNSLIRYVDAVDIVIKLAYYKQRVSNNAMLSQIVPNTDQIYL